MKKIHLISVFIICQTTASWAETPSDTLQQEQLEDVTVIAEKFQGALYQKKATIATTTLNMKQLERLQVTSAKDLSASVPNLYMPDYGSRITSSMYVRGMGARIDNPVMGLYVDGVPYFNKNNFDFNFCDIRSVVVMRGPQSTMFGRNTMGGVIDITTLSPLVYQGTRVAVGYGNGNSMKLRASTYRNIGNRFGLSLSAYANHTDGFFTNTYNGDHCDWGNDAGLRFRFQKIYSEHCSIDNSMSISWVNQGGYAYQQADSNNQLLPIRYNDRCGYSRLSFHEGLTAQYKTDKLSFNSVTAYQYMDDCMRLDQDFTPASMFTLQQKQKEHTVSQEFIGRINTQRYESVTGSMLFFKHLKMDSPVLFKQDGIQSLILANANNGLHNVFPDDDLLFKEEQFYINSQFTLPTFGVAIYHKSTFKLEGLNIEIGARLDYENSWFKYNNDALIHYRFTGTMSDFKALPTVRNGRERQDFLELLPRIAVTREVGKFKFFASWGKGYKAGGFNTQLFSDILQNAMTENLMDDLGVHFDKTGLGAYSVADVITYKPEHSRNIEFGFKYSSTLFKADVTLFDIKCRDQQLTVFPAGTSTGRMMTNAGRTHNCGVEASVSCSVFHWLEFSADYGYTHAIFKEYNNGKTDYADKHIPYAPQQTVAVAANCRFQTLGLDDIILHVDWKGVGSIYWNEENSHSQPFYGLLGASATFRKGCASVELWGKNLLEESYHTFYFVSMNNTFLQCGKPLQCGASLAFEF